MSYIKHCLIDKTEDDKKYVILNPDPDVKTVKDEDDKKYVIPKQEHDVRTAMEEDPAFPMDSAMHVSTITLHYALPI
jgi:hypothetical protein